MDRECIFPFPYISASLGLFSSKSTARTFSSHSLVDWNTGGLMLEFDYTSVNWTLDCPSSSNSSGLWVGISSLLRNGSVNRRSSSCMTGLQNVGIGRDTSSDSSSTGLRDWTSPFAGDDMFSFPR
ncbi:hypothetical protein RJT34_30032 [Clitoria ternatea]|uniref:Uncharacterized protein n=1 Tax=Clitoria ternatea TaxID=43366 RepID=A0AAN9ESP3_CLITE